MYAIGSNAQAAALAGINVAGYRVLAYVISGTLAAFGGILLAARLGRGDVAEIVYTTDFSHDYVTINADYRS